MTTVKTILTDGLREKRREKKRCAFELVCTAILGIATTVMFNLAIERIFLKMILVLVVLVVCAMRIFLSWERYKHENGWVCDLSWILDTWYLCEPGYEAEEDERFAKACINYCLYDYERNSAAFAEYWFGPDDPLESEYEFSFWYGGRNGRTLHMGIYKDGELLKDMFVTDTMMDFESLVLNIGRCIIEYK